MIGNEQTSLELTRRFVQYSLNQDLDLGEILEESTTVSSDFTVITSKGWRIITDGLFIWVQNENGRNHSKVLVAVRPNSPRHPDYNPNWG